MELQRPHREGAERPAWVALPENEAARRAVEDLGDFLGSPLPSARTCPANPLFLHGPPGTGKSQLVGELADRVSRSGLGRVVAVLPARDLAEDEAQPWRDADLVVVEDVQHLPPRAVGAMVELVDRCLARRRPLVGTALEGPARLAGLPARLTSRLAGGLVVALHPLGPDGRREFLRRRAAERGLGLSAQVLDFLAEQTPGSGRQLDGALGRVAALAAALSRAVEVADLEDQGDRRGLTLERIVDRVGAYYRVDPRQLCSGRRSREVLLPRQVGMYLARELTALSLEQIGSHFGGRDHSTVLHACRKVADLLPHDAGLSGAVRRLRADLG